MKLVRRMLNYPPEISTNAAKFVWGMVMEFGSMWLLHWFDADLSAAVYRASGPKAYPIFNKGYVYFYTCSL
jgi:hypothetical protein